jgi:putative nucleotidyltransferase with HDIG domain
VFRLGFDEIYQIVACAVSEASLGRPQAGYGIGQGELWRHSAVAALASKVIAVKTGMNENLLFTAALLHDLGKLALSAALEGTYDEVVRQTESGSHSFLEAEQTILGTNHAEVGGRLLERWQFPDNLVRAVCHHHDPMRSKTHTALAAGVHLADVLAHMLGHGYGHNAYAVRAQRETLALLELTARDVQELLLMSQTAVENFELLKAS